MLFALLDAKIFDQHLLVTGVTHCLKRILLVKTFLLVIPSSEYRRTSKMTTDNFFCHTKHIYGSVVFTVTVVEEMKGVIM